MTAFPSTTTAQDTRPGIDPKEKARVLHGRLMKGLDLILEAHAAGNTVKADSLQALYDRLEAEYLEAKKEYSKTPEDLLRCPDCPYLGEGLLAGGSICDSPCQEARSK